MPPATPIAGQTKKVSATSTVANATLDVESPQIIVTVKSSTDTVFMRTGESSATAVVDQDVPVPDGQYTFTKPNNHLSISFICAGTGTATVWVSPAMGE